MGRSFRIKRADGFIRYFDSDTDYRVNRFWFAKLSYGGLTFASVND
jgi:hypothetical protein